MRISDWSSDVCSSDLGELLEAGRRDPLHHLDLGESVVDCLGRVGGGQHHAIPAAVGLERLPETFDHRFARAVQLVVADRLVAQVRHDAVDRVVKGRELLRRSEEHTSELQSLMRISYAVFCFKKKQTSTTHSNNSSLSNILHTLKQ